MKVITFPGKCYVELSTPPPFAGPTVRERIYRRDREDRGRRREKRSFNLGFLKFRISGSWGILNIPGPFPGRTVRVLNYRCFFTVWEKKIWSQRREMAIVLAPPGPIPFLPSTATAASTFFSGYRYCSPPQIYSLSITSQLYSQNQTPPTATTQRLRIDKSLLHISEANSEAELWAAACLRVRSFYEFKDDSFGIQVSQRLIQPNWIFSFPFDLVWHFGYWVLFDFSCHERLVFNV